MALVGPRPCLEWEAAMFPAEFAARFGPLVTARAALEPQGRWDALVRDLVAHSDEVSTHHADGYGYDAEYRVITARRP